MKIFQPTRTFEYFGTPLKIVSILKHEYITYWHPGSAQNIWTLNWIYGQGSDMTNRSAVFEEGLLEFYKIILKEYIASVIAEFFQAVLIHFCKSSISKPKGC